MYKKLTKSYDKKIAGVCGGIAEYFDVDPTIVRIAYALFTFVSGILLGTLVYIICMLVMPEPLRR